MRAQHSRAPSLKFSVRNPLFVPLSIYSYLPMMRAKSLSAFAVSLVLTIAACGDSTAPSVDLDDAQIADMMDAMASAGVAGFTPPPTGTFAVITFDETVDCPSGGTSSVNATIDDGGTTNSVTMSFTQGFSNCKSTSSTGRMWTFNGKPNIVTTFTGTSNEETGAFSLSGTQTGGLTFSSDLGSGACDFDLTYSMSGNNNTEEFTGSVSGTVCGRNFSQSLSVN